ncbi:MAG: hypothetical protein FJW20_23935 [Acidimicrobiia bacterium]|nr:hypothetical protein [Acidimicrobiia bacterium]
MNELSFNLADFLHEFEWKQELSMVTAEPSLLAARFQQGDVADAYLAATAEALARRLGHARPEWTEAPERYLTNPWFATPGPSMRACLLLESPAAFRQRNLFVSANALSVA